MGSSSLWGKISFMAINLRRMMIRSNPRSAIFPNANIPLPVIDPRPGVVLDDVVVYSEAEDADADADSREEEEAPKSKYLNGAGPLESGVIGVYPWMGSCTGINRKPDVGGLTMEWGGGRELRKREIVKRKGAVQEVCVGPVMDTGYPDKLSG
jgi:hypothetical protein